MDTHSVKDAPQHKGCRSSLPKERQIRKGIPQSKSSKQYSKENLKNTNSELYGKMIKYEYFVYMIIFEKDNPLNP